MEGEGDGSNGGGVMPHQLVITNGTIIEEGKTRLCLGSEVIINKQTKMCLLFKIEVIFTFQKEGEFVFVNWLPTKDAESGKPIGV